MIGITLASIVVARQTTVERTHVALNEHELLNSLGAHGAQGIPQFGMDEAHRWEVSLGRRTRRRHTKETNRDALQICPLTSINLPVLQHSLRSLGQHLVTEGVCLPLLCCRNEVRHELNVQLLLATVVNGRNIVDRTVDQHFLQAASWIRRQPVSNVSWVEQIQQTVNNAVHELEASLCQDNQVLELLAPDNVAGHDLLVLFE